MDVRMSSTHRIKKSKMMKGSAAIKGATSSHEIMYGPPRKSFSSFFLVHEPETILKKAEKATQKATVQAAQQQQQQQQQ